MLIQKPNSICAKLLKAKYFPNGNILDTVFTGDASPAWRGIEHGLSLLKRGTIWRIRNGSKTRIWRDNWIPRASTLRVTGKRSRTRLKWVKDLFYPDTKLWNEQLIREIFHEHDAEEIIRIKVPQWEEDDFVAWHFENSGVFSVKSAYKLGYNLAHENRLNTGRSYGDGKSRNLWKLIWKAPVPNKIRMFSWRLADDNLPTKKNKWGTLEVGSICNICAVEEEDSYHATVACTKAKAFRNQLRKVWKIPAENKLGQTWPDWLLLILANTPKICHAQILLVLWRAWPLRNGITHEKGKASISASVSFLQSYVERLTLKDNISPSNKKVKAPCM